MDTSEKRKIQTRKKILEAGRGLFSKNGYHRTQVMDIVTTAGMSAGTFYNYFKDKKDLFEQIAEESVENLRWHLKQIRTSINIWDKYDRAAKTRDSLKAFFDHVDANPQQVLLILRGDFALKPEKDAFDFSVAIAHDLAADIQNWIDQGVLADVHPLLFSHAVMGMALQILESYLVEKVFGREQAIQALESIMVAMFEVYLTDKGKNLLDMG